MTLKSEQLDQLIDLIDSIENERLDTRIKRGQDYKETYLAILNDDRVTCFGATEDGEMVGWIAVERHWQSAYSHCGQLQMGVRIDHQNQGIGKALLNQALEWASTHDLQRIELTVETKNKRALWLFSRFGFSVEGTRRLAFQEGSERLDEFYMSLLLKDNQSER